jgi:hypothetical protein
VRERRAHVYVTLQVVNGRYNLGLKSAQEEEKCFEWVLKKLLGFPYLRL